jgi:hypothetical protein
MDLLDSHPLSLSVVSQTKQVQHCMSELWDLVWGKSRIDGTQLASAIEREVVRDDLDYRTRLLIRDGEQALADHWGIEKHTRWLLTKGVGPRLEAIRANLHDPVKFPSIKERLVARTHSDTIQAFLRDLGTRVHQPTSLTIGGSGALILQTDMVRATEDIDVVDEVPEAIRELHGDRQELQRLHGLHLAHFQSHYLPKGWEARVHTLGSFGRLQVSVVDVQDVFLSKLFSAREKDVADLRALYPHLDRDTLERRLRDSCTALLDEAHLRANAERNWYVLTGESL